MGSPLAGRMGWPGGGKPASSRHLRSSRVHALTMSPQKLMCSRRPHCFAKVFPQFWQWRTVSGVASGGGIAACIGPLSSSALIAFLSSGGHGFHGCDGVLFGDVGRAGGTTGEEPRAARRGGRRVAGAAGTSAASALASAVGMGVGAAGSEVGSGAAVGREVVTAGLRATARAVVRARTVNAFTRLAGFHRFGVGGSVRRARPVVRRHGAR